jgi:peptidoglycan/LPS O-acetylase OafA/YrhL
MVVCIAHLPNYINKKLFNNNLISSSFWANFSLDGIFGVELFFMISGFVLGHAFAKTYITKVGSIKLKNYYLRRLTRIEPPYLLALIVFFIALVFVINKFEFSELFPNLLASFFYVHNLVFHHNSEVMPVAWSLEAEVQFYLVAPLLALIYKLRKREIRWLIFAILILTDAVIGYQYKFGLLLVNLLHFFLFGMLIADLYVEKLKFPGNPKLIFFLGITLLPFIFGLNSAGAYFLKYMVMALLFYIVLTNEKMAKLFSIPIIAIIGGMCYSIYLLHEQVISATGRLLVNLDTGSTSINFILFFLLLVSSILFTSAIYYRLIEQPCMKTYWWKNLFKKSNSLPLD